MLRFLDAGESHGPAEIAILEGIPSGLPLAAGDIQTELDKRRSGAGRGGRGSIESDNVSILSGVRKGLTLGSPIALLVENRDFDNWKKEMNPENNPDNHGHPEVTNPRPGHADLAGALKYRFSDIRNVLERASARETVMRVAVGAITKKLLGEFGILIASHTLQIGPVRNEKPVTDFNVLLNLYKTDPLTHCFNQEISVKMKELILEATLKKDTLGGVIEIIARNVPAGLGSHVHWDRKLDGKLARILMSIQSVKAVEIGTGIDNAGKSGSQVHDEIFFSDNKYKRNTNRAGGIEGGISNGEDIICRVYHKPISTLGNPLNSVDMVTKNAVKATIERSDICVIPRAGVISESAVAFVLAEVFLEKFGNDSLDEIRQNFKNYSDYLANL